MRDKDRQRLIDLAKTQLEQSFTREEALEALVTADILEESGELPEPYQELAGEQDFL